MSERVFQLMNVVLIGTVVAFLWAAYYAIKAVLDALEKEDAAEQSVQADGGVCTCRKPIATTSTNNQCGCCGKPRRR